MPGTPDPAAAEPSHGLTEREPKESRWIKRRLRICPAFHQTDMMGVVHNAVHFLWFEEGRLQILFEILPWKETLDLGIVLPVVDNTCHYHQPIRFGDPLLLFTSHRVQPSYEGRLAFHHSLVHEKLKTELASGSSAVTLVVHETGRLVKEWPAAAWRRYQALA